MAASAHLIEDPDAALAELGSFLRSRPVEHNLILTLILDRSDHPIPGRYWVVTDGARVVGAVFQSPLDFPPVVTPMGDGAIRAAVEEIAGAGIQPPGVIGDAGTAARFAGHWVEVAKSAAIPVQGQRIHLLRQLRLPKTDTGALRVATPGDFETVARWVDGFAVDTGGPGISRSVLSRRVGAGQYWLWQTDLPVSMAAHSTPVEGVVRIQVVYTPPDRRRLGHAGTCVGHLSAHLVDRGHRCILFTDLGDPVSNSVYRRLGYEAVGEVLRYRFVIG